MRTAISIALVLCCFLPTRAQPIAAHKAVYDAGGVLQPWAPWREVIDREMRWYLNCPIEHGYPRFVWMTFMDGDYRPVERRPDFIPAMQNGMGIISYLKYYKWTGRKNPKVLEFARYMGDYLVKENLTPDEGKFPRFPRSTGLRGKFPQPSDCGSQADKPYEVQPDKAAIAAYALVLLYDETKDQKYLDVARNTARVLAANMRAGDEQNSPWPFRVDFRTGEGRGPVGANQSFILRLFDILIARGDAEFTGPREKLWAWIRDVQIPDLAKQAVLWVQFFEDYEKLDNRNAWAPLNLARYLLEKKDALDPAWREHAKALIEFVNKRFISMHFGVAVCGEQDYDKNPWGGILANWGGVLAMYTGATGSPEYKLAAWQALTIGMYAVEDDGCPRQSITHKTRGGWQEDAHTDRIHNLIDAMRAVPEWGR
ncbi:MAG: hypothetical protein ABFD86_04120 [Bryobacteraceae bacterium]